MKQLQTFIYILALPAFLFSAGGLLNLVLSDTPNPPGFSDIVPMLSACAFAGLGGVAAVISGFLLFRRDRRRFTFATIALLLSIVLALACGEFLARAFVPSWPAMGLHGVQPEVGYTAWAHSNDGNRTAELNAWGQRDRSRTIVPPVGSYRIAFVGDSFLEESPSLPVSLAVEQQLTGSRVEVLNLGVSATDPDEYFYRLRNIALPLHIDHCVLFVFAGNDFSAPQRTLESCAGIMAVYPRDSLFSTLHLYALNHLWTNERRQVLQAWFAAGNLHERESRLGRAITNADDQTLRDILYTLEHENLSPPQRRNLAARLNHPEMELFFDVLRHPDQNLFRSYYLSSAVWSVSVLGGQWPTQSEDSAFYWVSKAQEACQLRNVAFTLVIIPEAFQVDSRMHKQWMPLTDMRQLTETTRSASQRLLSRARAAEIHTLDLHEVLDGVPGTYLNLDGHWSDKGVQIVADAVAKELLSHVRKH